MNIKINTITISIILITLLILSGCITGNIVKEEKVIKIGSTQVLSGKLAYIGEPISQGIEAAFEEINYKIGNNKIELILEDNQGDAKKAVTDYHNMESRGANVIFTAFTYISSSLDPLIKQDKTILMYASTNPEIAKNNDYAFKTYSDITENTKLIINKFDFNKKFAVIYLNGAEGVACYNEVKNNFDENNFLSFAFDKDETNFKTQILKLKQQKIENIIFFGFPNNYLTFIKQCVELDYSPKKVISAMGGHTPIIENSEKYTDITNTEYITVWSGDGKEDINYLYGYYAGKILISGLRKCEKLGDIDNPECLKNKMKNMIIQENSEIIQVNNYGNVLTTPKLFTIKNKKLVAYN